MDVTENEVIRNLRMMQKEKKRMLVDARMASGSDISDKFIQRDEDKVHAEVDGKGRMKIMQG